jgi:hypothetical protein
VFAGDGKLTFEAAKRQAAQEIAAQERQRKRSAAVQHRSSNSVEGVTVSNARRALFARLSEIGSRLKATAGLQDTPAPSPQFKKYTQDLSVFPRGNTDAPAPSALANADLPTKPEPDQPPTHQVIGVYGTTSKSIELIPDSEYRHNDLTTQNWRRSCRGPIWIG